MDIIREIRAIKEKKNAVILAHNYQVPQVQDIADYTGDSLGLSVEAAKTDADIIVFCGVYFMAETAKILSPRKAVLIPKKDAGCPMADMITARELKDFKAKHPKAKVLCYVNTPADVKAESDYCCTSANAVEMLKAVSKEAKEVIFVPDKYLASYASSQTGIEILPWHGYCPTHAMILPEYIKKRKEKHPQALVMAHPECSKRVLEISDVVVSTSGMLNFAKESDAKEFIVATEIGMLHPLKKENPEKAFYPASDLAICPNMKKITLEDVYAALRDLKEEVMLPQDIIEQATKSIQNMIAIKRRPATAGTS